MAQMRIEQLEQQLATVQRANGERSSQRAVNALIKYANSLIDTLQIVLVLPDLQVLKRKLDPELSAFP